MPQYLENNICKFEPLFEIDYSKKINIVSIVLFKLNTTGYKPFTKYINGIKYLSNFIHKKLHNFHLRLFIDDSIYNDKEIFDKLKSIKDIEIVHYNCPNFKIGGFHRGLFGTMIRFFPMFDFKNNDADQVIITDIDFENDANFEKESFIINTYLFIKSKKKLDDLYFIFENFGLGKPSRDINLSMDNYSEKLKTIIPQIIAGQIVNLKRVSSNIIIKYLSNIDSNNKVHSVYSKNSEKLQKLYKTNNKKFVYGVDEYFLNYYLLDFIQKHKLEFCSKVQYNVINLIYSTLFYWNKMKNNLSKKEITFFKKFFNFILKDIDEFKFTNIQDAFNLMDKYTYYKNYKNNKKFSKNHIIIFKRLYAFYKICREKNIKYLNPMYLNFILDYMKNRLHIYEYRFYFSKKAPIILEEIILP